MTSKSSLLFLYFLLCLCSQLQSQVKVLGRVIDKNHRPLALVSVVLLQDSSFIVGTSSDELGRFQLIANFKEHKKYSLTFSLVAYQTLVKDFVYPDTSIVSTIVLVEDKTAIGNVTVTAWKPLVTRKADRYIINVEKSFLADGNSGLEVLQKSPGIWVDSKGVIHIKGNQPVIVMINDVVQRMGEDELAEYLKTLKSEDISKIEVIANPPAEFEAAGAGGIIHIVLKKLRQNGMDALVNTQYKQQGSKPYQTVGASLNYKMKALYFFCNVTYTKDIKSSFATTAITYPNKNFYKNHSDRIDNTSRQQYRVGLVYDINKKESISMQTTVTTNDILQSFVTDGNLKTATQYINSTAYSDKGRSIGFNSTTLNYSLKLDTAESMLKMIVDYSSNSKDETNYFSAVYIDPTQNSLYRDIAPNGTDVYTVQADYNKAFKNKAEIKAGIKYAFIKRDNELLREDYINNSWVKDNSSNRFIYKENLVMFYSSLEKSIKQINIKAGLRGEQTYSAGNSVNTSQQFSRKYFGLFPSFFITQTLNEAKGNAVYISYAKRLQRPTLLQLNPSRWQFDSYTSQIGNPNLLPQYSHHIQLGYNFLNKYAVDIYFIKTENVIALIANSTNNNIEYQMQNFNSSNQFGLNIAAPFKVMKGWSTTNNLSFYNLSYSINTYAANQTTLDARSIHNIFVKNIVDVDIIAGYRSASVTSNYTTPSMLYVDIGFSKKLFNSKAKLRLYFTDIFSGMYEKEVTDNNGTFIDFYQKRPTRTASISFSYNFSSGKKMNSKKIEQSGSEEKSRIGN